MQTEHFLLLLVHVETIQLAKHWAAFIVKLSQETKCISLRLTLLFITNVSKKTRQLASFRYRSIGPSGAKVLTVSVHIWLSMCMFIFMSSYTSISIKTYLWIYEHWTTHTFTQYAYSCVNSLLIFTPYMHASSSVLTCNADVCLAALGGSSGAPGHALTPVIFRTKQLLDLLSCNFYTGFSYHQTCRRKEKHCWIISVEI